jgi:adenine-specific DNA-methyltransferase
MELQILKPRKALNKAFLKVKPTRAEIERFKANLVQLLDRTNAAESEEFHKNLVIDFLKKTYYDPNHFVNTKGKNDLVIHNGDKAGSTVGVIVEAKKPTNKSEMVTTEKLNTKAFQELVLYYLRERITNKNMEVKHLVATNINEWFIFDATTFDRLFAQNKNLVKQFEDFVGGRLADTKTEFFYKQIAGPFIAGIQTDIEFAYFNLQDYQKPLRNDDQADDTKLIALFKLLSPEHLLKLPFANDSNSLDKRFYGELLHIIGLTETKAGGKKLIGRNKPGERYTGTMLEDAIIQLDSLEKLNRVDKPEQYGNTAGERLFNVALELSITWINRILFLKLLEAQLVTYHRGDQPGRHDGKSYSFLNIDKIKSYDDLNSLFFQVLAHRHDERNEDVKRAFEKVPYLNSSLFEPTDIEQVTLFISNLKDDKTIPIFSHSVLKDQQGKKRTGHLPSLQYLFAFLEAYDFSSEGAEAIQEDHKALINASVLGLIFEKINGYKDGSFFTPGFITMYMCRETIRKAVVQKFNETKKWNCAGIDELCEKIENRKEANEIVNSIKICDPAVGSGHFLVSALNEMIAVKNDLGILCDFEGRPLKNYWVEVVNDELFITEKESGEEFFYIAPAQRSEKSIKHTFGGDPVNFKANQLPERQVVQQSIFREKQTIIENCLFGVDINPNSVKICRLRLWIELLKNAYYTPESNFTQLETLPNIDINIKCGNTLVSRFAIDADLKQIAKSAKWNIFSYQNAVGTYKRNSDKELKRELEKLIRNIKKNYVETIQKRNPKIQKYYRLRQEYDYKFPENGLFVHEPEESYGGNVERIENEKQRLIAEIEQLQAKTEAEKKFYETHNAFEWRFEFPEVLNEEGDFLGFDLVVSNPPYIRHEEIKELKPHFKSQFKLYAGGADVYVYFIEKGFVILKDKGFFTFIMPNKFMQAGYGQPARKFLLEQNLIEIVDFGDIQVFEEATTYPCILSASKERSKGTFKTAKINSPDFIKNFRIYVSTITNTLQHNSLTDETWVVSNSQEQSLLQKIISKGKKLEDYVDGGAKRGVLTGLTEAFVIEKEKAQELIKANPKNNKQLHPFLLGREVKPYMAGNPSNYLIKFEKGFTRKLGGNQPEKWFAKEFPELFDHFAGFKEKAIKRLDKGDFYWELRACDYYDRFEKPKIMYQVLQVKPCFIYDEDGLYCNNSMWFIPSNDKVLLGILNSKMGWWLISKYCTAIQNGYQLIWKYFGQIPIATGKTKVRKNIADLVNKILSIKEQSPSIGTTDLENQIDQLVYQLYNLTEEEIKIIEESVK